MSSAHSATSRNETVQAFGAHESRTDGARVVAALQAGLDKLLYLVVDRVATEPETKFGVDSMIMPTAIAKGHLAAHLEIELYQAVESADTAAQKGYVSGGVDWYLPWLLRARLHERFAEPAVAARLGVYRAKSVDARRLAFETALERALPQASHAPLVLYRLLAPAVEIATAIAFGDAAVAQRARKRQLEVLPDLADCHDCHGRLLENGEECRQCGNPLWKSDWLTAE